jgi:hypothetical protein
VEKESQKKCLQYYTLGMYNNEHETITSLIGGSHSEKMATNVVLGVGVWLWLSGTYWL